MDPNTLNLDPVPGFWPNLDPDPGFWPNLDPDPEINYEMVHEGTHLNSPVVCGGQGAGDDSLGVPWPGCGYNFAYLAHSSPGVVPSRGHWTLWWWWRNDRPLPL